MAFETSGFSKKQKTVLTWWCEKSPYKDYDAIICDGAVRSGKTTCMSLSFVAWAFWRFSSASFAICGRTITSLKRNVVTPMLSMLTSLGFVCEYKSSASYVDISLKGVHNRFYLFGGKDESSAALIQGITLSGVLLDEVALMPRSFVEQALARCSVSGSKLWFNCNPEHPYHWFYREWIKKAREKNALYLHFLMQDNPSLSKEIIKRYKTLYSGVFYDRFVLGKWCSPEGLVYPMFSQEKNTYSEEKVFKKYYLSCDYGTVNPFSVGMWGIENGIYYRVREFYYASRECKVQKTDEEYYSDLMKLCESVGCEKIAAIVIDPSAASFIECVRRHGKLKVIPAKNEVIKGIANVSSLISQGKIKIHTSCSDTLREFSLYSWDLNSHKETVVKEHDHAMDDIRYFVSTLVNTAPKLPTLVVSSNR